MNREQQRQNARDQRRLDQRKRQAQASRRPSAPELKPAKPSATKRPAAARPAGKEPSHRNPIVRYWLWIVAAIVVLLIVVAFFAFDPLGLHQPLLGQQLPSQGNLHVNPGGTHVAYSTNPPTSGPHFPQVPTRGVYTTPFVTEYLPHFLEHGGVEVLYNSSTPSGTVKKLTDTVNKELDNQGQVLLAPRPDMPCEVTLTSWQHMSSWGAQNCQPGWRGSSFDPNSSKDVSYLTSFIERNECQYDPENQCGGGTKGSVKYPTAQAGQPTVTASLGTATPIPGQGMPQAPAK